MHTWSPLQYSSFIFFFFCSYSLFQYCEKMSYFNQQQAPPPPPPGIYLYLFPFSPQNSNAEARVFIHAVLYIYEQLAILMNWLVDLRAVYPPPGQYAYAAVPAYVVPPPAGYPPKDGVAAGYPQQVGPMQTKERGHDGFWKGWWEKELGLLHFLLQTVGLSSVVWLMFINLFCFCSCAALCCCCLLETCFWDYNLRVESLLLVH